MTPLRVTYVNIIISSVVVYIHMYSGGEILQPFVIHAESYESLVCGDWSGFAEYSLLSPLLRYFRNVVSTNLKITYELRIGVSVCLRIY